MAKKRFTFIPDSGWDKTKTERLLTAKFSDGYSQQAPDGLNAKGSSWALTFTGDIYYIKSIESFLDDVGTSNSFVWTTPLWETDLFKYSECSINGQSPIYTLSVKFERVYEASFMTLFKSQSVQSHIKARALELYPNEACGVLTLIGGVIVAANCTNVSLKPQSEFLISTAEYNSFASTTGVYGVWHSHTDEPNKFTPSSVDITSCNATLVPWGIVDVFFDSNSNIVRVGNMFYLEPQ